MRSVPVSLTVATPFAMIRRSTRAPEGGAGGPAGCLGAADAEGATVADTAIQDSGASRPVAAVEASAASRRRSALGVALVVALVVGVYSPMLSIHPWGDDFENLHLAYPIHESPWRALELNFVLFRPVTMSLMYLTYLVSGTNPLGYNLLTLLLVVTNVLLLRAVARRLGLGRWAASAAALLYGTTPLASEATTWGGTRADQMLALWTLLLLLAVLRPWRPTSLRFQLTTAALLVAAAATKENWIVLPVVLGATLLVVRRETLRDAVAASTFGVLLAVVYVGYFVVWPKLSGALTPLDYSAEVSGPVGAVVKMLQVVAWYSGFGHPSSSGALGAVAGAVVVAVLAVAAVRGRRRDAQLGLLLLVLELAPSLHFPVSPTRFNLLPLLGFWVAVAALAEQLVALRPRWRSLVAGLVVIVVVLQALYLRLEIRDYRWYGELHRQLVVYVGEIVELLPAPGVVVVLNAGDFNGPEAFRHSVRGLPKYVYPKPGGMWDLIFFHSLAEFAGRPFEVRLQPVPRDRITAETIAKATVLLFRDEGFTPCEPCREEVMQRVAAGEPLPERVGVFSVMPVGARRPAAPAEP